MGEERGWRRFFLSFFYATRGLVEGWRQETNFRIQCGYSLVVLCLLAYWRPAAWETLLVVLSLTVLMSAELMNSSVERVVDLVSDQPHPLAAAAKDLAASAVLMVAVTAALVSGWVILPRLPELSQQVAGVGGLGWFLSRQLRRGGSC